MMRSYPYCWVLHIGQQWLILIRVLIVCERFIRWVGEVVGTHLVLIICTKGRISHLILAHWRSTGIRAERIIMLLTGHNSRGSRVLYGGCHIVTACIAVTVLIVIWRLHTSDLRCVERRRSCRVHVLRRRVTVPMVTLRAHQVRRAGRGRRAHGAVILILIKGRM